MEAGRIAATNIYKTQRKLNQLQSIPNTYRKDEHLGGGKGFLGVSVVEKLREIAAKKASTKISG